MAQQFRGFVPQIFILNIPEHRDLGDSSEDEIQQYIEDSVFYLDYYKKQKIQELRNVR